MAEAKGLNSLTLSEHISPEDTGDNVSAKRVAVYYWDGSNWQRQPAPNTLGFVTYNDGTATITNSSAETTVVAADSNFKKNIFCIVLTNKSTSTAVIATLRKATGGTITHTFAIPPTMNAGFSRPADSPTTQDAVNNNWTVQLSVNTVTVDISVDYVKA